MFTIDKLKAFGCNVEEGLSRCMNEEFFYIHLVTSLITETDKKLPLLEEAINQNDLQKAFEYAHGLKGVYGNLAITPLYEKISNVTELLRAKEEADYPSLIKEIKILYEQFKSLND